MIDDTTIFDRGIYVPVIFMRLCKNANTAILLGQIFYWNRPTKKGDSKLSHSERDANGQMANYLVKQYSELTAETGIDERTLRRSFAALKLMGIVTVKVRHSIFHRGEQALFIMLDLHTLIEQIIKLDGKQEVFSQTDKMSDSQTDKMSDSLSESTTESKDKDVAPKPARYGYLKSGSSFNRNSTAGTDSDEKGKIGLEALAPIDLDVVNLVLKHNPKAKKELSAKQVELLRTPVATLKGEKPSPYDMALGYSVLWKRFVENIEDIPAWKKRVVENCERVTPGLVINFFRGYEWQGGLLSYFEDRPAPAPSATDFYEDT